jgi:hypothetical protein
MRAGCIPSTVIASQRVGAKRRPMTGSAKQSISQASTELRWIASSQVLLAMTEFQCWRRNYIAGTIVPSTSPKPTR